MYYNQELGLCIEFGPVRDDSVRRGGPPWIKSPLRRFTPSWTSTRVTCDCLLPFVHPLLSQVYQGVPQFKKGMAPLHLSVMFDCSIKMYL